MSSSSPSRRSSSRYGALQSSSLLVLWGALLSGPVSVLLVSWTAPQPPWTGDIDVFLQHYHPIQTIPYVLGYLLLTGFVWFTSACHALSLRTHHQIRTSAALVCTTIYATMVFTNYTLQVGSIPILLANTDATTLDAERHSKMQLISFLTMSNPQSLAWFLEMFGYAALGVATCLVAPVVASLEGKRLGSRRTRLVHDLLVVNGVMSVAGAACTATWDAWVFSTWGLLSFLIWNAVAAVCFGILAMN